MKTIAALLLSFTVAVCFADEAKKSEKKTDKKAKPAAKSDKNVFQKTESSVGKFMNDNKIWVTHPDKSGKKSDK
jgi:hypothetical protein